MKLDKKSNFEKTTPSEASIQGLEFGIIAIAVAIIVLLPVVLDLSTVVFVPEQAYSPPRFQVLIGFSAILLVAVLGLVALRRKVLGVPVLVPALALLGVSALSVIFSEDPWNSLIGDRYEGLLSLGAGVLLFYALAICLNSPLRVRVFLAAGVSTAVLVSIHGIFQRYGLDMISGWSNPWYTNPERSESTLGYPIALAAYLTLMMGAAAALSFKKTSSSSSWSYRMPWLFALAVIGACWIYTDTRAALLGAMVALPVVLWFSHRKMGTVRPLLVPLVTLIAAMAVAVVAWAVFAQAIGDAVVGSSGSGDLTLSTRIMNLPTITLLAAYLALIGMVLWLSKRGTRAARFLLVSLGVLVVAGIAAVTVTVVSSNLTSTGSDTGSSAVDSSSQIRLYIWRDTVSMILNRPLLGSGPDNFEEPFKSYISEDLTGAISQAIGPARKVDRAHSDFLQVAATTGLLGLVAYIWVFVSYFRNVYQRGGWPLIALSGAVLAYVLQLQVGLTNIATSVAFWGILGVSAAIMRLQDRETLPETGSIEAALTVGTPRRRIYEPLVVVLVVAVLVAIAIPAFLSQREQAASFEKLRVKVNVTNTVSLYEQTKAQRGVYPEAGVYTGPEAITGEGWFVPSPNIKITTETTPQGDFTVEGESNTLSGTFRYSYDSATMTYAGPVEATN